MKLFTNATLKLAGWYLIILMTTSLTFSVIIFQIARSEIETRITRVIYSNVPIVEIPAYSINARNEQMSDATANLLASLGYLNLIVLLAGGAGAYYLAKQTLKPIESAHEAQSRFVANASHQLRTPLAIMKAETEFALEDKNTTKQVLRETLSSNLEEVNHLSDLSTMLLELSKRDNSLKNSHDTLNLTKTIQDLVKKRRIKKRVNLTSPDSLNITSHVLAVREICTVLIDNAIRHSPKNSPIDIVLIREKNCAKISISNSGPGIDPSQIPHVFERFYRASHDKEGYGLGLALAKQLTDALGGNITVNSEENKTTTFIVTLPQNFS